MNHKVLRACKKTGKYIIYITSGLLVLISILVASLFLVSKYKVDLLCNIVERQLDIATGLSWELSGVKPSALPPGVSFDSIAVYEDEVDKKNKEAVFTVQEITIEPDLAGLFVGRTGIKSLVLESPAFVLKEGEEPKLIEEEANIVRELSKEKSLIDAGDFEALAEYSADKESPSKSSEGEPSPDEKALESGETIPPADRAMKEAQYIRLVQEGLDEAKSFLSRRMRRKIRHIVINNASFEQRTATDELVLTAKSIRADLNTHPRKISTLEGEVSVPDIGLELFLDLSFRLPGKKSPQVLLAKLSTKASITPPESRAITGSLDFDLFWEREGDKILIEDFIFKAEGDALKAKLSFDPKDLTLTGPLIVENLSLPRWFYFARNLPPGLQDPLDKIKGRAWAYITPFEGHIYDLVAEAGELKLDATVGADDFLNPVVKAVIDMGFANVDMLFPFLSVAEDNISDPEAPVFDMPHLIPFPGPAGADAPDVWYDVLVRSQSIRAHTLPAGPVEVRVTPVGETLTRVDVEVEDYAEGRVTGRLDIDVHKTDISFDLYGNNLALLPENKNSSVVFGGYATGNVLFEIDVKDTVWSDKWKIKISGAVKDKSISLTGDKGWGFIAKDAELEGKGDMYTVRSEGIKLVGLWNIKSRDLYSTWHPEARDSLDISLNGAIAWPEFPEGVEVESSGIERIYGDLVAEGGVMLPLGEKIIPLEGVLKSPMEWQVEKGILDLPDIKYEGLGSVSTGPLKLDTSGKETIFTGVQNYRMAPRTVLAKWNMLPDAIEVPSLIAGTTVFKADSQAVRFDNLKFQADGAPVTGNILVTFPEVRPAGYSNLLFDIDLKAERLDIDNYILPASEEEKDLPPSKEPWNLTAFQGIDVNYKLFMDKARFRKANINKMQLEGFLDRGKMGVNLFASDVYTGRVTSQVEGFMDPYKSTIKVDKGNLLFKGINLSGAFSDMGEGSSYGGMADMVFDATGIMANNADFPGALSGRWSIEVRDGIFPAFMGSDSGLRNTFSKASLSGAMTKGVLHSDNFVLKGSMVDMKGGGEINLKDKNINLNINVTVVGVPTMPVSFTGPFSKSEMRIGGANRVAGTAQAAGGTIFNLFFGVLELPARAVMGVGDLFTIDKKVEKKVFAPQN